MKAWYSTTASMLLLTCLTACGGGGADGGNEGEVITTPPPVSSSSSSSSSSGSSSNGGPIILQENFGDGLLVNFDEADTEFFFSQEYKALESNNPQDPQPSFYYPTCCFFEGDDPTQGPAVNLEEMGIVSDNGNPALLLNTGRFTAGQTRPEIDDSDPKKDTTTSDDVSTWGELDLSQDYRISFCIKASSGTRNAQIYVDNNTSGQDNSIWGGGGQGSRIFNVPAGTLAPGQRVEINVPGNSLMGGEVVSDWPSRPRLVGTASSFLQFRVEGGSSVIFDDLLVEPQDENGQAELPECTVFQPATAPEAPEAPILSAGDAQIDVSWSDVIGAIDFDLAVSTDDDVNSAVPIENIAGTKYTLEELENGTEYFVFLRVRNSAGTSDWSPSSSATPVEPMGCTLTKPGDISTEIAWSLWDGCVSPDTSGALVLNAATSGALSYPGEGDSKPEIRFKSNSDGTSTLDTTADADARSKGDLAGVVSDTEGYPQHFTLIARVDVSASSARGMEVETVFNAPSDSRVKLILRPDQGDAGRIQLERFLNGVPGDSGMGDTAQADVVMTKGEGEADGYHIYHISYTVEDPTVAGADNVTARIYRDGENISDLFTDPEDGVVDMEINGTGRAGGGGANRMRVGEDSSSGHFAEVDWMLWSNSSDVAAKSAEELVGELPEDIGELGFYAGASEPFWTAEALDLAGDSGSAPAGSIAEITADSATFTASGGNMSSSGHRIFYIYQPVTGDFTFTARLTSVGLPAEPEKDGNNAYRYGIMAMENIDAVAEAGSYEDLGRWLSIGYFHDSTVAGEQQGSRTVKVDKGAGSSRSRSSDDHQIGHYLRITRAGDDYTLESSSDGESFTELRSGTLENANGNPIPDTWYLGLFAAPGDEATLTFEDISIE